MKAFFGGVPTGPDVKSLIDAFGVPDVGLLLTHDAIEKATGLTRSSCRYKTVVSAWRKTLLDLHKADLEAVKGVGFRCLTNEESITSGMKGAKSGVRKVVRSANRACRVVTDDPILVNVQGHMRRLAVAVVTEGNRTMKEIEISKPSEQQPRLPPKV